MKVIVTGASGLVGHAIVEAAHRRGFDVVALYHQHMANWPKGVQAHKIDLGQPDTADRLLLDTFPDMVINAAAASSPSAVEADPAAAEKLNVALPRRLAELCNHLNARLLHLSTDMVFDGREGPYRSTDNPCPGTLYGQLKLMAERDVLKAGGNFATVLRVAIVTGDSPSGHRSVHERLFAAWAEGKTVTLFNDELRQPVAATSIAELAVELAERPNLHGIFHWAGSERVSRYELGCRILRRFGLDEDLVESVSLKSDPEYADRPADLTLELGPLVSKMKTEPASLFEQMEGLKAPAHLYKWVREHGRL